MAYDSTTVQKCAQCNCRTNVAEHQKRTGHKGVVDAEKRTRTTPDPLTETQKRLEASEPASQKPKRRWL